MSGRVVRNAQEPLPVVHARDLKALISYYNKVLRFELLQEISGVIAVLRKGSLQLQLWQSGERASRQCTIHLRQLPGVFAVYADLANVARSAIVDQHPCLRPWGAWEFTMCDPQGNRLTFSQSAANSDWR